MNGPSLQAGVAVARRAADMAPSILLKRSESAALSPGAIAGAVIGSILGASIIALCVWPFIARARRRARGEEEPFNPEAEIEAAQASGNASSSSPGPGTGSKRLSVDDFSPAATRHASRQPQPSLSKEYGRPGSDFGPPAARGAGGYGFQNQSVAPAGGPNGAQFHQGAFVQQPGLIHQSTMGTLGTLDTTGTGTTPPDTPLQARVQHRRQSSSKSSISKAFQSATSMFRRTSTRSIPTHHSPQPPQDAAAFMPPQHMPSYISPIDNMPPTTGAAASYYSGAPMSPATSAWSTPPMNTMQIPGVLYAGGEPQFSVEYQPPGIGQQQDMGQQFQLFPMLPQQQQLAPPQQGLTPMSPASQTMSPLVKDEMMSDDEDGAAALASPPIIAPGQGLAPSPSSGGHSRSPSLTFPRPEQARVGMSPTRAGPGTVNPVDIMAPTNDSERIWQVQNELVKPEQTTPPPSQLYESFPGEQEQPLQVQLQLPAQQQQQQPTAVTLESTEDFMPTVTVPSGNAADEADAALFKDFCDLDANAKEEWTTEAYQDDQEKRKRRQQLAQQQQLQEDLAQQHLLQQQMLQAQQLQQFQQQAQLLVPTQGPAQQPVYYDQGQMQFGFQQGNSQLGNPSPGYQPQTPIFIKADPDSNYAQQPFTPMDLSDGSTPHKSASYSSGPSNMNTPNTLLTEPGSSYAPTTPSHNGLSPAQASDASPQKTYPCPKCDKVFTQQHKLNHHDRYHTRKFVCPYEGCDGSFGTTTHLRRHINDRHKKERKFHCTVEGCQWSRTGGLSFPRKDNWKRHMVKKHPGQPHDEPIEAPVS